MHVQQGGFEGNPGQQGGYTDTSGQQGGYTDASGQQDDFNNDTGAITHADASDNDYSNNDNSNYGYSNNENSSYSGPSGTTGRTGLQAQGEGLGQGFDQGFGQGLAGDSDGSQPHEGVQVQEQVTPDSSSRDTDLVCVLHCLMLQGCLPCIVVKSLSRYYGAGTSDWFHVIPKVMPC